MAQPAFYSPLGETPADGEGAHAERFGSSELTRGPWDDEAQHAGPPAALLARAVGRMPWGGPDGRGEGAARVGRITYEILGPVPIAPLVVSARVARPGRSVEMLEAELAAEGAERPAMRATAWRLASSGLELPEGLASAEAPSGTRWTPELPPPLERSEPGSFAPTEGRPGYGDAVEYRFGHGHFTEPGPASVWFRLVAALVDGEEPRPLERVAAVADAGNGISATLDWRTHVFINVDLSIHLAREPVGEWQCLSSITYPERDGTGLTDTTLWDARGFLGRAAQTLLVRERGAPGDGA